MINIYFPILAIKLITPLTLYIYFLLTNNSSFDLVFNRDLQTAKLAPGSLSFSLTNLASSSKQPTILKDQRFLFSLDLYE